jgi:L-alanine-DL-glutamate epimerase-like enolase superfamily enzyme
MKVTGISADQVFLRTRQETTEAAGIGCVVVRIATDEGYVGYGEAVPGFEYTGETATSVQVAITASLGPSIVGRSPFDVERISAEWRATSGGLQAARAGVELALWDLQGKATARPLFDLIGGRTRQTVPETYPFDRTEPPEDALHRARALAAAGVGVFKVYLSVGDPPVLNSEREAIVGAVREGAGPDAEIRVDANGGWPDVSTAVMAIRRLERWGISMIEEPVHVGDFDSCREIRARTSTPLCLDESVLEASDALAAIRAGACDVINVKLMKTGGILGALKLNAIAEAAGVATHVGNMGHSTIGVAAILHLHAALSNASTSDVDPPVRGGDLSLDIASGPVGGVDRGLRVWAPPPGPGLGVELIDDAIRAQLQPAPDDIRQEVQS